MIKNPLKYLLGFVASTQPTNLLI